MKFFKTKYRIVTDTYAGYEVQLKFWWLPFYIQWKINTHSSPESAEEWLKNRMNKFVKYIEV